MKLSEILKNTSRLLARLFFDRRQGNNFDSDINNILLINWKGMIGDATISSLFISTIKSNTNIKIHVITTVDLEDIYINTYKVDSVYIINKEFTIVDIFRAAKSLSFCDTIIPLIGRMQWRDIFFAGIIRPNNYLSVDSSLNMSNLEFDSNSISIDQFYRLLAKSISPEIRSDKAYLIPEASRLINEKGYIAFNPFASRSDKSLSVQRSVELLISLAQSYPRRNFYVLYSPKTISSAKKIVKKTAQSNVKLADDINNIRDAISYIMGSDIVISVDTSSVHLAYGLGKRTIAIYPKTDHFNAWMPPKNDKIEFIFSTAKIISGIKCMDEFYNQKITYAINRLINSQIISDGMSIFLYYNRPFCKMPISQRMNVNNLVNKTKNSGYRVILTNLDKNSENYIENYIELPDYFFDISEKIIDKSSTNGNQSDIIRLRLLNKYGGAYFDTSTIFLKNSLTDLSLYNKLLGTPIATLAGYTNVTFTRKNSDKSNYFKNGKDGLELGLLYAKKDSNLLGIFINEIDKYWVWKSTKNSYLDYPPFSLVNLQQVSFLNEYHIHYSIYHLIITKSPQLLEQVITESIHMKHKENSNRNGPNTLTDMFCRGKSCYGPGNPEKLLECFDDTLLESYSGTVTSLSDRAEIVRYMELISTPGYLRTKLEERYKVEKDYLLTTSLYSYIYEHLV